MTNPFIISDMRCLSISDHDSLDHLDGLHHGHRQQRTACDHCPFWGRRWDGVKYALKDRQIDGGGLED
jgi:hypothetical protein